MHTIIHGLKAAVKILDVTENTVKKIGNPSGNEPARQIFPADQYQPARIVKEIIIEENDAAPKEKEKPLVYGRKGGRLTASEQAPADAAKGRQINLRA